MGVCFFLFYFCVFATLVADHGLNTRPHPTPLNLTPGILSLLPTPLSPRKKYTSKYCCYFILLNIQMAYLSCGTPEKAVDTFHAVTGIVWPESAPWPDPHQQASITAADGNTAEEFPEEFRLLQAGPSAADAMVLEATSREGTGGQRFLQMRAVAEQVAEDMSNRVGGGGAGGSTTIVGGGGGGVAGSSRGMEAVAAAGASVAATAAAAVGPLKRPALGEYVGGCRPNGMLVATVVKAHGRSRRLDDACRMVLRMADWGLKPDVAVFNSFAAAAVWNGRVDLALQVCVVYSSAAAGGLVGCGAEGRVVRERS